jgi:hypothetical protein
VSKDVNAVEQVYEEINIDNSKLEEIPENAFGKMSFEFIFLRKGCSSLKKIHPNTFLHQYNTAVGLFVEAENVISASPNSFYDLANSFIKLQNLRYYSKIGTLEEKFSEKFSKNLGLTVLRVDSIKGSPFSNMSNIDYITIQGKNFNRIQSGALKIGDGYNRFIGIDLTENKLNGSSFEKGCFTDSSTKQSIRLSFSHNQITYLDEAIFLPFLVKNASNTLWFSYTPEITNPLDCDDCRSAWICKSSTSHQVRDRIVNAFCVDGRNLTDCIKKLSQMQMKIAYLNKDFAVKKHFFFSRLKFRKLFPDSISPLFFPHFMLFKMKVYKCGSAYQ